MTVHVHVGTYRHGSKPEKVLRVQMKSCFITVGNDICGSVYPSNRHTCHPSGDKAEQYNRYFCQSHWKRYSLFTETEMTESTYST